MNEIGEIQTSHVANTETVEDEDVFGSDSEEVVLKSPKDPITRKDIRELMNGWEDQRRGARARNEHTRRPYSHGRGDERKSRA